jgi:3-phenylpropionate/trans-cinnamate dioxygenase ferredoxin subunit
MAEDKEIEWHHIAYPHEITDAVFPVKVVKQLKLNGRKFALVRTKDGFFVLDDSCPHAGVSLSQGRCDSRGNIICPLHRQGFNLRTGKNASGTGPSTCSYPTDLRTDGLYMALPKKKWWLW